jgi:hypothetical protein
MNARYAFVAERAGHRCEYCRAPEVIFNFPFEIEHIIPPGLNGPDLESNWALACRSCNLHKSNHLHGFDEITQLTTRLFHPRVDEWQAHFEYDRDTSVLNGLTATGQATIAVLRLNAASQIAARKQ